MPRARPPPPVRARRAADVAAHALPGDPVLGISSAAGENPTQTHLQLGGVRGKSALSWIVIIGPLTTRVTIRSQKTRVMSCVFCELFVGSRIIHSSLEYLLFKTLCADNLNLAL